MKKLTFAAAVALTIAVLGTSCTKTPTTPAEPGKAMLTLNLELNTNEANDTLSNGSASPKKKWENNFPADFAVQFVYDSKGLHENPASGFTYDKLVVNGTYANGKVSVVIPSISKPDSVEVKFPDLELTRTWRLADTGVSGFPARDTTEIRVYERATEKYAIWDGAIIIKDHITYQLK